MNKKYAIVSHQVPIICTSLKKLGFELIYTDCVVEFISYEQYHADMQCIKLCDILFVLRNSKNLIEKLNDKDIPITVSEKYAKGEYPANILLNALSISNNIVAKIDSIDNNLLNYAKEHNYNLINVKQGYTACSCCKISENAVITSDPSIYKILRNANFDVLKIREGHITLYGANRGETGFIGGASVLLNKENVLFFGNIINHPDYDIIKAFCNKHNVSMHYIEEIELTDIGGAILC